MKKYLVMLTALLLVSFGCVSQKPLPRENVNPQTQAPQAEQNQAQVVDERNEALRLSNHVTKLEGVQSATVVLMENTAYVGLRLNNASNRQTDNQIQERVTDEILEKSPGVETVYVATHPDTVARIEQIYLDIQAGRIASSFRDELQQIKVGGQ